jgi:hypothetical protein
MTQRADIQRIFAKFAGQKVTATNAVPDAADPVLKEMSTEAERNGLRLRLIWPGRPLSKEWITNRVNVHLEEGADGAWHVSRRFGIG